MLLMPVEVILRCVLPKSIQTSCGWSLMLRRVKSRSEVPMATDRVCLVQGCTATKKYYRGFCSKHYQQFRSGKTLEMMEEAEEVVAIPKPPKPPVDKKRCSAMVNGKRCIRGIRATGFCSAHWKEASDKSAYE